jgi:hypothetical protein
MITRVRSICRLTVDRQLGSALPVNLRISIANGHTETTAMFSEMPDLSLSEGIRHRQNDARPLYNQSRLYLNVPGHAMGSKPYRFKHSQGEIPERRPTSAASAASH